MPKSVKDFQHSIRNFPRANATGFTLVELLVVIVTVALLAGLLVPALTSAGQNSRAVQCLNNNRQLCLAWRMYSEENNDYIVYSGDSGSGTAPYQKIVTGGIANQGNLYAWTWSKMDFSNVNPYNYDIAADMMLRPLWQYCQKASIYKCPSDSSYVTVNGVPKPRIRTMSMNIFLGGFGGSALDFSSTNIQYALYFKTTDFCAAKDLAFGPAKLFVFLDERQDAINWGNYETDMAGYSPTTPGAYAFNTDLPGFYHNYSCNFSFADGHCEMHQWQDSRTTPPLGPGTLLGGKGSGQFFPVPYDTDVAWLQDHTTRPK